MSFLQPILLIGLPLALLPIIIHLINQHRHRTVPWAAMMFLLDAKKLTKGIARLRQILILALRVLAVILLLFAASRPLAGGWAAMTGGKADTILILLDRSASMEQQTLEAGESKRLAALTKLADLIEKTGRGSEVVLIDSVTLEPTQITDPAALAGLPQSSPTATAADIPALLQRAAEFLATDESGRTDIWLASDLRENDWDPGSARWQTLRAELSTRESTRLMLLTYPEVESENLSVSVAGVKRRKTPEGIELVMDLTIKCPSGGENDVTIPVEFTINGTRTVQEMTLSGTELVRLGHVVPLGQSDERGWGRIDLPADDNPADNTAFLVFDDAAVRKTVIVSDDTAAANAIAAAAGAAVEQGIRYETEILTPDQTGRIPWSETALLIWHAPLPAADSAESRLLAQQAESGRTLILLPPPGESDGAFLGFRWEAWTQSPEAIPVEWWRTESGLLAHTQNGEPLPVGDLSLFRTRLFSGETQPLLRLGNDSVVIARLITETPGAVYVWGTLPRTDHSSLATDGVVFFVMLHRALSEGANAVALAQFRETGAAELPDTIDYALLDSVSLASSLTAEGLLPKAVSIGPEGEGQRLLALNRPASEDDGRVLSSDALKALFEGVDFREISDEVNSGSALASEIWRLFLVTMALALLAEAILCLPPKTPVVDLSGVKLKP